MLVLWNVMVGRIFAWRKEESSALSRYSPVGGNG